MTAAAQILAGMVKPLVWELDPDRPEDYPKWTAATEFGKTYSVFKARWGAQDKWGYVGEDGFCHTPEAAQAAAEADYRARIAAALEVDKIGALVEAVDGYLDGVVSTTKVIAALAEVQADARREGA